MRTVVLLRHGKSDWDADYEGDHERPLARRGRRAAAAMGRLLAAAGPLPERVLCSSALRARDTVRIAARAGDWRCPVESTAQLYESSPEQVLGVLRAQDDALECVLLAGHEPTWSLLAGGLAGDARLRLPTAAMVRIDLAVERWRDADFGSGTLIWIVPPRLLDRLGWPGKLKKTRA